MPREWHSANTGALCIYCTPAADRAASARRPVVMDFLRLAFDPAVLPDSTAGGRRVQLRLRSCWILPRAACYTTRVYNKFIVISNIRRGVLGYAPCFYSFFAPIPS